MPCAGEDAEHHESVGHVVDHDHAAMHANMQMAGVTQAPDTTEDAPDPMSCAMGMMCSGTVVTPLSAMLDVAPVVHSTQVSTTMWAPHLSDLSLPDRPPRA